MKVLVVGAAGRTGRAVVAQALSAGHEVTAFVHSQGYDVHGVAVHVGDASDIGAMQAAVAGHDAVVDTTAEKTPYKRSTMETRTATSIVQRCGSTTCAGSRSSRWSARAGASR